VTRGATFTTHDASVAAVQLHVIYRSTDRENRKARPAAFSKHTALLSFLRAREACAEAGDLVFLNNGSIAADRLALMEATGTVKTLDDLQLHESYWAALRVVEERSWPAGDLVYFGEDDYLYRQDALASLVEAARVIPEADYLAPYATVGRELPNGEALPPGLRSPRDRRGGAWRIGDCEWRPATSHTSSFAVRAGALRADLRLHRIAPRCSGAWDHALALAYQGYAPYGPLALVKVLAARDRAPLARRAKVTVWRISLTALALARRRSGRLLVAPRPALATHLEEGVMAVGTDWAAENEAALG
jgi:hypothetical protein